VDDAVALRESIDDEWATPQRGLPPTERQFEVLLAVVQEHGNAQAARKLGIRVGTLKGHLTDLYARGPYHNIVHAVWSLRHELERMEGES
jgi:DNA-binding CsgD family transcriptional regulator